MKTVLCVCLLLALTAAEAKRFGGFSSRRGGSSSKHRTPSPPSPPAPSPSFNNHGSGSSWSGSSSPFLNAERSGSTGGTTHNRGNPFGAPPQTNGPIGFEKFGGTNHQGNHQIGFDKVNSQTQNKPNTYNPSAPPGPVGPPPSYPGTHTSGHFGTNDHPPAYPGRPMNAPPAYSPTNPHYNQQYPGQQQHYGNGYQQNQFGAPNYGSYQGFGNSPYSGNFPGNYPGSTFGGGAYGGGYHGNTFGGSPFGGAPSGYGGNPYFSPNNFGYSSNPGYFGGQYNNYQQKSRFGGMPIPIPIPIPIPFGGGFGGFGGGGLFGGHSSYHSYNHRVLDTFIKSSNSTPSNNYTSVFLLNNSTVTPCTTDHFLYDAVTVTTMACTAQACTAVKVFTRTNMSNVESVHEASVTLCFEGENATVSSHSEVVAPTLSEIRSESFTVCRNVSANETAKAVNQTTEGATTTTAPETTTLEITTTTTAKPLNTTVCEKVNCSSVEMCPPAVEVVEPCPSEPCPFKRKGYKPCVTVKMCRAPSAPVSTFATLNMTISKIDEYNNHQSVHDVANLTLISYHPPVITVFNSTNSSTPAP